MNFSLALALGLSLSLDAFAVSCAIPCAVPRLSLIQALRVAGTFGVFQALMPLAGWMAADLAAASRSESGVAALAFATSSSL